MDNKVITKGQEHAITIKQHNAITEARYDMSATEKNIIYMLLAQLEDDDPVKKRYMISMRQLQTRLEQLGQVVSREQLQKATSTLISRVYSIIEEGSGDYVQMSLFASVIYTDDSDLVEIELSPDIRPYLFQLKNNFTSFELDMALSLKSKYSQRMYEILSKYRDVGTFQISVEKLKYILELIHPLTKAEMFKEWSSFSNDILEVSKKEIDEHTDICFIYTLKKTGRKYTDIEFHISKKGIQTLLDLQV